MLLPAACALEHEAEECWVEYRQTIVGHRTLVDSKLDKLDKLDKLS